MMLAGELALARVDVAIVERRASPDLTGSRGGGLHSRTIEVLDQRGIAERFIAQGQVAQVAGFAMIRLDLADIQGNIHRPYGRFGFPHTRHFFFHVADASAGRRFVQGVRPRITTAESPRRANTSAITGAIRWSKQPTAAAVGRAGLVSGPSTLKKVGTPSSRRVTEACRMPGW